MYNSARSLAHCEDVALIVCTVRAMRGKERADPDRMRLFRAPELKLRPWPAHGTIEGDSTEVTRRSNAPVKQERLMLGWFRALMPKEERFFELFVRHAQVTLAAAEALRALLSGGGDVIRCCDDVTMRENEADEITREVLTALRRSFITPLDRGDIKDLITSMDDAIDQMNKTVKVIRLFEFRAFSQPMRDMGELIVRASKISLEAVPLLQSVGKEAARLNVLTEEIIRIEGQSDELHDEGRRALFLAETNAIAFMIGTEVYDHLEKVVDRFEDVANEISAIVIENV